MAGNDESTTQSHRWQIASRDELVREAARDSKQPRGFRYRHREWTLTITRRRGMWFHCCLAIPHGFTLRVVDYLESRGDDGEEGLCPSSPRVCRARAMTAAVDTPTWLADRSAVTSSPRSLRTARMLATIFFLRRPSHPSSVGPSACSHGFNPSTAPGMSVDRRQSSISTRPCCQRSARPRSDGRDPRSLTT